MGEGYICSKEIKYNQHCENGFFSSRVLAEVFLDRTAYSRMNLFNKFLIIKYRFNTFLQVHIQVHLNLQ